MKRESESAALRRPRRAGEVLFRIDEIMRQEGVEIGLAVAESIRLARTGEPPVRMRLWWGVDRLPGPPYGPFVIVAGEFFSGTGDWPDCETRFECDLVTGSWSFVLDVTGPRACVLPDAEQFNRPYGAVPGRPVILAENEAWNGVRRLGSLLVNEFLPVPSLH